MKKKVLAYLVIFEKTKTGYSVFSPDIPGCVSAGKTKQEAGKNMKEAIILHLQGMREDGLPIPKPATTAKLCEVGV